MHLCILILTQFVVSRVAAERKAARTHAWRFERTDEYRRFMETYRRFVLEFVQPQIYDGGAPPQRPKGFNHGRAAQSTMAPAALLSPKAQRPLCSSHTPTRRAGAQRRSSTSASPSCAS